MVWAVAVRAVAAAKATVVREEGWVLTELSE
jgi:hypothetical protein